MSNAAASRPTRFTVSAVILGAFLLVGCTTDPDAESAPASTVTAEVTADLGGLTEVEVGSCVPDGLRAVQAGPADDPTTVVVAGGGTDAVLLVPQSGGDECQWAQEARRLAGEGYLVATFGWAGDDEASFRAATSVLDRLGAQRTAFVGASKGGTYAVALAQELGAVAVVAISSPATFDGMDAVAGRAAYTGPLLVVASADDRDVPASQTQTIARPDDPEGFVQLEGSSHGVAILSGPVADELRGLVDGALAEAFAG
ncbi:alpha/beta hydrolase family protein [Cellulomonas soli]|uniref:alpha/beta hydrolase family protein n=1 Tax=Cellulomonas soli TaxID=931535 RepID=UPI003F825EBA